MHEFQYHLFFVTSAGFPNIKFQYLVFFVKTTHAGSDVRMLAVADMSGSALHTCAACHLI